MFCDMVVMQNMKIAWENSLQKMEITQEIPGFTVNFASEYLLSEGPLCTDNVQLYIIYDQSVFQV